MDLLLNPEVWVAFLTLLALEIVLGIDNIVFISILVDKLPEERQALARRLGLGMALVMRIILLLSLSWVIGLTAPLFTDPWAGDLRARPDTHPRRALPAWQEHLRDPREPRG